MRRSYELRKAVVTLLFCSIAAACADDATGPDAGAVDIAGTVALAKTGEGVANAIVVLIRDGRVLQAVPTDAGGSFAFRSVEPDSYTVRLTGLELTGVSLSHTSFEPLEQKVAVGGGVVDVVFSAFGLIPPRVVGTVRCDGQAVEGAELRVIGGETDTVVRTNAQGRFSALDLGTGYHTVVLHAASGACRYDPAYRVVHLRAGQAADVDFEGASGAV
ncbi:MAG TPA: carboxypeptidase-like regulatory domain-containing protein [Longimicrobiales bacterium]